MKFSKKYLGTYQTRNYYCFQNIVKCVRICWKSISFFFWNKIKIKKKKKRNQAGNLLYRENEEGSENSRQFSRWPWQKNSLRSFSLSLSQYYYQTNRIRGKEFSIFETWSEILLSSVILLYMIVLKRASSPVESYLSLFFFPLHDCINNNTGHSFSILFEKEKKKISNCKFLFYMNKNFIFKKKVTKTFILKTSFVFSHFQCYSHK